MVKIYKIVFLLFFTFALPFSVRAANLTISPSNSSYEVGDTVTIKVIVSSDQSINAISGLVKFPEILTVESISKAGSVLNFWVTEPSVSRTLNTANFEGVSLTGFLGSYGDVVTIRLKAIREGTGSIALSSGQVLANDGNGTDLNASLGKASINIKKAQIKKEIKEVEKPVVVEEPPKIQPSLVPPEIYLGLKYGSPAILGQSNFPKEQILLTYISESGTKIFINGNTDENGDFLILVPNSLKYGIYNVTGTLILRDGRNSPPSEPIKITVGSIFSDIRWELFILPLLLIIVIIYQAWRISNNQEGDKNRKNTKKLKEVKGVVHKSLNVLRDDIKNRKLSSLKKDLDDAEELIDENIDKTNL
jgi:hypothetical protein